MISLSCAIQKDEVYLNLVLDFVPETVYRVARHFNKAKSIIPIIYVKVIFFFFLRRQVFVLFLNISQEYIFTSLLWNFWNFFFFVSIWTVWRAYLVLFLCCDFSGVHVPVVSQSGLYPFPGRVSQRHQTPKSACRPRNCHPQAVWLWQVSSMNRWISEEFNNS